MRVLFGILVLLATIYNPAHAESYTVICPENYYIIDEHCVPCPNGMIAPGNTTECTRKCPDGEYCYEKFLNSPSCTCTQCPDGYPHTEPDAATSDQCYSDTKTRQYDGTVTCRQTPDGCTSATCTVCESEPAPCEYVEYANGTVKSGCGANVCTSDVIDWGTNASDVPWNPNSGVCEKCPAGTYVKKEWNSDKYIFVYICEQCAAGTYSDTTNASECTACPDDTYSTAGATQCVAVVCDAGYYSDGTTCTKCPDEYPNSDIGATDITNCYSDTKLRPWTGEQITPTVNDCDDVIFGECKMDACEYVAYCYKFPWDTECSDETVKSGCATNNAGCTKPILSATAKPGYRISNTTCEKCPEGTYSPGGNTTECIKCPKNTYNNAAGVAECTSCPDKYPNTENIGSASIGDCYNNELERPWSGKQICRAPLGCTGAICPPCEIKPCKYAARPYVPFPWENEPSGETVISGCETNNANCSTPITAVVAAPGWRSVGTSRCEQCPNGTYGPGGENAECTQCPENKKISPPESISQNDCGRILKYQMPNTDTPMEIFLNGIRNTSPSFNVKIGNDILYANMTPVDNNTTPGMYVNYDNQTYIVTSSDATPHANTFTITTTDNTTTFSFSISAAGFFTVNWGDGITEQITRTDTSATTYSHTYDTAGAHKINIGGNATGYSSTDAAITFYITPALPWDPTITPISIGAISGSLGKIFPTIDDGGTGNQPLFKDTFNYAKNLTGEIPKELFYGIGGTPAAQMFVNTFKDCSGLTGLSPHMSDGTPLYTWAASVENACPAKLPWEPNNCGTFNGATGLSDYGQIPDEFK